MSDKISNLKDEVKSLEEKIIKLMDENKKLRRQKTINE
jgi:hypothetical protein